MPLKLSPLKEFRLTLEYPDSDPISVTKKLQSQGATSWQSICNDVCGQNYLGTKFKQSILERWNKGKGKWEKVKVINRK